MKRCMMILLLLLVFAFPALAQDAPPIPYTWDLAGVTFLYPSDWDTPATVEIGNTPTLQLAEVLAATPEIRPPAIAQITISLVSGVDASTGDLTPLLQTALGEVGLQASAPATPITLLNGDGQEIVAASSDNGFYGIAQAVVVTDGSALVIVGRALEAQRERFEPVYNLVSSSLAASTGVTPPQVVDEDFEEPDNEDIATSYGILWRSQRSFDQGEDAFLNLVGLAYAPNNRVYTYDYDLGLVQLDAQTGAVLGIFPNENILEPTGLAADASGAVYVSDILCGCIYVFDPAGSWREGPIGNLGENMLQSIAITPDGRIFGTTENDEGFISIVVLQNGTLQQTINLSEDIFVQPILLTDRSGRVLALTQDGEGIVLALDNNTATPLFTLGAAAEFVLAAAADLNNNFILATDTEGVIIVDSQGTLIDQPAELTFDTPQGASVVYPTGAAMSPDGTLYVADSDGQFGAVIALSTSVEPDRVGAAELFVDIPVEGALTAETPSQTWTFQGTAGQRLTISAIDTTADQVLNVALRLLAPDGSEEAFNDDQEGIDLLSLTDAQIVNHTLAQSGTYSVVVEAVEGEGGYRLAMVETQDLILGGGSAAVQGSLDDVRVVQHWALNAQAGQTVDITLNSADGVLDPILRVISPQGEIIAENDDAEDPDLGSDSQLLGLILPEAGIYIIEAARFDGSGSYTLQVTSSAS